MMDPFVVALTAALESAKPTPPSSVGLENTLLVEQLADDAQTWHILNHGGHERNVLARPFVHSPLTMVAGSVALNALIRLLPNSQFKHTMLKITVHAEEGNIVNNLFWHGER